MDERERKVLSDIISNWLGNEVSNKFQLLDFNRQHDPKDLLTMEAEMGFDPFKINSIVETYNDAWIKTNLQEDSFEKLREHYPKLNDFVRAADALVKELNIKLVKIKERIKNNEDIKEDVSELTQLDLRCEWNEDNSEYKFTTAEQRKQSETEIYGDGIRK